MRYDKYYQSFTSLDGQTYNIEIWALYTEQINGSFFYGLRNSYALKDVIIDITDLTLGFDKIRFGAPKAMTCKVKMNTRNIPDALFNKLTDPTGYYSTVEKPNLTPYMIIYDKLQNKINVPQTLIIIKNNFGNALGYLCQKEQTEWSIDDSGELEVEYMELARHICEQIDFGALEHYFHSVKNGLISGGNFYIADGWINWAHKRTNEQASYNNEYWINGVIRYNSESLVFFKLKDFHNIIFSLIHSYLYFILCKSDGTFSGVLSNKLSYPITHYRQSYQENNANGVALNYSDVWFLGFAFPYNNYSSPQSGRLCVKEKEESFFAKYKNVYNYLSEYAEFTQSQMAFYIYETNSGADYRMDINLYRPIQKARLSVSAGKATSFEFTKSANNRFKITASNYDQVAEDLEKYELGADKSRNAEEVIIPMVWNNRPYCNSVIEKRKDSLRSFGCNRVINDSETSGGTYKFWYYMRSKDGKSRFTDLFYFDSTTFPTSTQNNVCVRVSEVCDIYLGYDSTQRYKSNASSQFSALPYQGGGKPRPYDYREALESQRGGYCLDALLAKSYSEQLNASIYSLKITTTIEKVQETNNTAYADNGDSYHLLAPYAPEGFGAKWEIDFSEIDSQDMKLPTIIKPTYDMHLLDYSVKSLKEGTLELTFIG